MATDPFSMPYEEFLKYLQEQQNFGAMPQTGVPQGQWSPPPPPVFKPQLRLMPGDYQVPGISDQGQAFRGPRDMGAPPPPAMAFKTPTLYNSMPVPSAQEAEDIRRMRARLEQAGSMEGITRPSLDKLGHMQRYGSITDKGYVPNQRAGVTFPDLKEEETNQYPRRKVPPSDLGYKRSYTIIGPDGSRSNIPDELSPSGAGAIIRKDGTRVKATPEFIEQANRGYKELINQAVGGEGAEKVPDAVAEDKELLQSLLSNPGEDREKKRSRLESILGIAEGLGNFKYYSGAMLRSGMGPGSGAQLPFVAEGLRRELAKTEDELAPEEQGLLEKYFQLDKGTLSGVPASRLKTWLPAMGMLSKSQATAGKDRERQWNHIADQFHQYAKSSIDKYQLARQALSNLKLGNQAGYVAAVNNVLRSTGEQRFTEQDFARLAKQWDLPGKFLSAVYYKTFKGTLTPEMTKNIEKVVNATFKDMQANVDDEIERMSTYYAGRQGITKEEIKAQLKTELGKSVSVGETGQPRVGDVMMLNGEKVRILKINPDGTAEYEKAP